MITYAEAEAKVAAALGPLWRGPGTFAVGGVAREDAETYLVRVGAAEWINGGDPEFIAVDDSIVLVDKQTGDITESSYMLEMDRIDKMRPVNTAP